MRRENTTLEAAFKRMRPIRGAVLITTLFAEVDYDAWLRELKFTSLFEPMEFMDLKTHRLQRKYAVLYYGEYPAEWIAWERLQHFFGVENYSEGFLRNLKKLAELGAAKGVYVYAVQSIPFEIRCWTQHGETQRPRQRLIVDNLLETTRKIRLFEHERRTRRRSKRLRGAPVFSIEEGIELNLKCLEIRDRISTSSAWCCQPFGCPERTTVIRTKTKANATLLTEVTMTRTTWSTTRLTTGFLLRLTGNGFRATRVSGVVLPMWYCREPFLTVFCSGLTTAKDLKFLQLEAHMEDDWMEDRVSWKTWAWLGYALFNKASTCSVETLSLVGFELDDDNLDVLEEATRAKDPLAYMWRSLTDPDEGSTCNGPSSRPVVWIATKAKLDLYDSDGDEDEYIEAPMLTQATAMDDEPIVDVFLPGFGFCRVDRENISHKRLRHSPANSTTPLQHPELKALLLNYKTLRHDDEPQNTGSYLPRLLEIVGDSLTSLSITAKDVKDESLLESLGNCRRLENLSLGGMTLKSMVTVEELSLIDVNLSSLELHDLTIPIAKFDKFVAGLDEDLYLRRLRIGEQFSHRFRTTTAEAMQSMLESNTQLESIHLYYTDYFEDRPSNPLREWNCKKFNKEPLLLPLARQSRLAFLSVLRSEASKSDVIPRTRPSEDMIEKIFEFAATTSTRMVIEERDTWFRLGRYR